MNAPQTKSFTLLAALSIMATALAGCATASASGTAQAQQSQATRSAESAWADDAELMVVAGFEGQGDFGEMPWGDDSEDAAKINAAFARVKEDGNVGDGKCEVWAYGYLADSKPGKVFIVIMDRQGEEIGTFEIADDNFKDQELQPIADYKVNSDAAVEKALDENEDMKAATKQQHAFLMTFLIKSKDFENPVWTVFAGGGDEEGDDGFAGFVVIDAVTGEVLFNSKDFGGFFGGN